jgi:hypothetical protein
MFTSAKSSKNTLTTTHSSLQTVVISSELWLTLFILDVPFLGSTLVHKRRRRERGGEKERGRERISSELWPTLFVLEVPFLGLILAHKLHGGGVGRKEGEREGEEGPIQKGEKGRKS